uniref:Uncharacterized protein n=1 Tax=Anguilla anguilla TaxID=7936 RepID=A0A0E9RVS6_ANGAN
MFIKVHCELLNVNACRLQQG